MTSSAPAPVPRPSPGTGGSATAGTIPDGYAQVDPRTARRVPLWHELGPDNPIFPGDPPVAVRTWATVADGGFLVEQVTSLGSHTGTHVSVPAHTLEAGPTLAELDESWTLMPLAVVDVADLPDPDPDHDPDLNPDPDPEGRVPEDREPDVPEPADRAPRGRDVVRVVGVDHLRAWERRHGRIPDGGCLLLRTGLADRYRPGAGYGVGAPGLSAAAVVWLFDRRGLRAVGSDSFGPDAPDDPGFGATRNALARGGITVENVGPGLARMRPHGDWISINGPRPRWSGAPVGITGFTLP